MIIIAGGGMSGAYLARRIVVEGIARQKDVVIYEPGHKTACGISPYAWGISRKALEEAVNKAELPGDYVLNKIEACLIHTPVKADAVIFDKPKFVRDCLDGFQIVRAPYNPEFTPPGSVVIDATARRAAIGKGLDEIYARTVQAKVRSNAKLSCMVFTPLDGGVGYAWEFPAGEHVHVGAGSVGRTPSLPKFDGKVLCRCSWFMRLSSPELSKPLVKHHGSTVIAVGESAGAINCTTGGGNKEGIDSVELLLKHWGDWDSYEKKLIKAFDWNTKCFKVIKKLSGGKKPGIRDARTILRGWSQVGIRVGLLQGLKIMRRFLVKKEEKTEVGL